MLGIPMLPPRVVSDLHFSKTRLVKCHMIAQNRRPFILADQGLELELVLVEIEAEEGGVGGVDSGTQDCEVGEERNEYRGGVGIVFMG